MTPEAGEIVWAELDPVRGTEQAGRRPALVITDATYHAASSRAVICPISSAETDWAFAVALPPDMRTKGSVLIDQVRTVHRETRLFRKIETVSDEMLAEVRGRLAALLGIAFPE